MTKWKLPSDEEGSFNGKKSNYRFQVLVSLALFIGVTLWVNAARANWPLWSILILMAIQLFFYSMILLSTWSRFEEYDHIVEYYSKPKFYIISGIFVVIGILSKILNLEIIIVPTFAVILIIISKMEKFKKVG